MSDNEWDDKQSSSDMVIGAMNSGYIKKGYTNESTIRVKEKFSGEVLTVTDVGDELGFTSHKGSEASRFIFAHINKSRYVHLTEDDVKTLIDHLILWRDTGSFSPKSKEVTVLEHLESMGWAKQIHNTPLKMKLLNNIVSHYIRASAAQSIDDILMKIDILRGFLLRNVVREAFDWDKTPEGAAFWEMFQCILRNSSDYKLGQSQFWDDVAKILLWYDASDGGANE